MTMYIFDEEDEYFRCPGGAIEAPGTLKLSIKLRRGATYGARARIYQDGGSGRETAMAFSCTTGAFDVYKCELNINEPGLYWYCFLIDAADGSTAAVPEHAGGSFQITAFSPAAANPGWIHGGVIYHIFVDRFRRGGELRLRPGAVYRDDWGGCPYYLPDEKNIVHNNDFFGGNLYGIIEKLPYLEEMGVTCIYLSPVFEAASNHKYDTGDFMKIDGAFGGDEAFEKLCSTAGARGIKVILDGVFNHVGIDSRYFNKYGHYDSVGAGQGRDSPYYDWFTFREDGTYDAWWGIELLPAINEHNPAYRDFICGEDGVIAHWTRKGVSGWRLDVVDELPDVFLDPLCAAMKRENCESLIVGEVWEDASNKIAYSTRRRYFQGGQLDSVTNYPLKDAMIACVKDKDVSRLADTVAMLCRNYPGNVLNSLMNILGTHDTMRILTVLSGADFPHDKRDMEHFRLTDAQFSVAKKQLKLASTLQFTLPGVPCVYYGDEAGMQGGADPFNRRCYPWGNEDSELIAWYMALSRMRKEHSCFKDGKYELIEARAGLFAFTRGKGNGRILVAVNVSDSDRTLEAEGFNYDILKNQYSGALTVKAGESGIFAMKGDDPTR